MPLGALPLVTGGDDLPVIALVLLINWGLLPFIVAGAIAAAFYAARWYRANHPAAVRPAQNRRATPQRQQDDRQLRVDTGERGGVVGAVPGQAG